MHSLDLKILDPRLGDTIPLLVLPLGEAGMKTLLLLSLLLNVLVAIHFARPRK